jgi:thiol-disulfide isomerase/thioredoxin
MKNIHILITLVLAFIIVGCSSAIQTNEGTPLVGEESIQVEVVEDTNEVQTDSNLEELTKSVDQVEVDIAKSETTLFSNSYREFTEGEYTLALSSEYYVVLDFYSDWCPSCKTEDSILQADFNALENIVIFRVNHGDGQTSDFEEALAEEFDISNRASGIILKDGVEVQRYSGHNNKQEYMDIFNSLP